jgi:hypothetical protein
MFRFGSEDTDLAARLNRLGYKIHNLQSAVFFIIIHDPLGKLFLGNIGRGDAISELLKNL